MKRYHKQVNFPEQDRESLEVFNNRLNQSNFQFSPHCLENLKHRAIDLEAVLLHIKNSVRFDYKDIFEYYRTEGGFIEKVCYRVDYDENSHIILVIGRDKVIITIYFNRAEDSHETLKKELYEQPLTIA